MHHRLVDAALVDAGLVLVGLGRDGGGDGGATGKLHQVAAADGGVVSIFHDEKISGVDGSGNSTLKDAYAPAEKRDAGGPRPAG